MSELFDENKQDIGADASISADASSEVEELAEESAQKENAPAKKAPKQPLAVSLLDYVEIFVFAIAFVIVLFTFVIRLCVVKGPSMESTLYEGEVLAVADMFYEPERGDIIVFHQTGTLYEPVVKRVIATEGETVDIDFTTWTVTITDVDGNTFVLDEPYMQLDPYVLNKELWNVQSYPYVVGEGQVFVMGDNRDHSTDSRGELIGPVDERRILGKVIFRVQPFNKLGTVE